jgi:phospholipid/cholesterol/gamma-HCH transport system ATP-binding protein
MGPSGCGKSTVLGFIGGRINPQKGKVLVDGISVPELKNDALYQLRKKMGMMFQHNALLTDLSVFENIAFALREHTDMPEKELQETVLAKLEMVGLKEAAQLNPEECSGGMQRRVALARAVAMNPQLVMYDEPFTGLDPISKGVITKLIREMNDDLGITSIIVTHDVAEACEISDEIFVLAGGKVIGNGSPKELLSSNEEAVRQFMTGAPDGPVAFHYQGSQNQPEESSKAQQERGL